MTAAFNEWLDAVADGSVSPTVDTFARSALTDLPRVTQGVRRPTNRDIWGDQWAVMQEIWNAPDPTDGIAGKEVS